MNDYQFPPQLGESHIYFGYKLSEWFILVIAGLISVYATLITLNPVVLLPLIFFALLVFKPNSTTSLLHFLIRAYNFFVANPISYDYQEEQIND